jgi:uncharacterized protein (TIGR02444 family)
MTQDANPFWAFSCGLYDRPGVAEACLALQDAHGVDVNLLLFCCWAGHCGRSLAPAELRLLMNKVAPWQQEVVRPLRGVRRYLKTAGPPAAETLRQQVKDQELAAEQMQQDMLHAALPLAARRSSANRAAGNLVAYLRAIGCRPGIAETANLSALLVATFAEELHPLDAVRLLDERLARRG